MNRSNPEVCTDADGMSVYNGLVGALGRVPAVESMWSVGHLMSTVSRRCVVGLGVSTPIVRIIDSLLWPFLARRSLRSDPFTEKELNSLVGGFRQTVRRLVAFEGPDNREQDFCKYWLDDCLCRAFNDPNVPKRPDWIDCSLFSGWPKKLVQRAVVKRDLAFIYSLAKGSKLSWPPLGDLREKEALAKHKQRLTRAAVLPVGTRIDIGRSISLTADAVFRDVAKASGTKFMPSGSACFEASRRKGGALSLFDGLTVDKATQDVLGKLPALRAAVDEWRAQEFDVARGRSTAMLFDFSASLRIRNPVEIVAIPEPSKFRIISKGSGWTYSALQPLQGRMIDAWKHRRESTMTIVDLGVRVNEMLSALPGDDFKFASGDYQAATDFLERGATLAAYQSCRGADLYELGLESLLDASAVYPDGSTVVIRAGQLMGHPLSFPLLCVINLGVYRHTVEEVYGKGGVCPDEGMRRTMLRHVLVNGDDILFRSTRMFYERFFGNSRRVGLIPSDGKNYFSPSACMINSQVFVRSGDAMRRVGYLNQRLIYGSSAKKGTSEALPTHIGKDLSAMADLTPWTAGAIPFALSRFSSKWDHGFQPNWYLPVALGGYGVDPNHSRGPFSVTRHQRRVAALMIRDPTTALFRLVGNCLPLATFAGALVRWKVVPGAYVPQQHELSGDDWLARIAYVVRAQHGGLPASPDSKVLARRHRYGGSLQPMKAEGLARWWNPQIFASGTPTCPPLQPLRAARGVGHYEPVEAYNTLDVLEDESLDKLDLDMSSVDRREAVGLRHFLRWALE